MRVSVYHSTCSDSEDAITELLNDFAHWIYRRLEREYDYPTNREAFEETCECNEWEFDYRGAKRQNSNQDRI
jgi:hypothetical protein